MPLDPHARRFLEKLAATGQNRAHDLVADRRRALQILAAMADPPRAEAVGGVRDQLMRVAGGSIVLRVYSPMGAHARLLPGMVFFHGGGWVAGNADTHDGLARRLCNETGCRLISVEYRLAPEHPFPEGLRDACTALAHVARSSREFGIDPARLGVAGDSAGANIAAAVCQWARDENGPELAFQLLLCPILDLAGETASRRERGHGYFCDRDAFLRDLDNYCQGEDLADPRLSPLRAASLADLPPAFIHTAQYDPFADEGEAYARRLAEAGVAVEGRMHPGMIHFFYCLPRMIPYALDAAAVIGAQIRFSVKQPPPRDRRAGPRDWAELGNPR